MCNLTCQDPFDDGIINMYITTCILSAIENWLDKFNVEDSINIVPTLKWLIEGVYLLSEWIRTRLCFAKARGETLQPFDGENQMVSSLTAATNHDLYDATQIATRLARCNQADSDSLLKSSLLQFRRTRKCRSCTLGHFNCLQLTFTITPFFPTLTLLYLLHIPAL